MIHPEIEEVVSKIQNTTRTYFKRLNQRSYYTLEFLEDFLGYLKETLFCAEHCADHYYFDHNKLKYDENKIINAHDIKEKLASCGLIVEIEEIEEFIKSTSTKLFGNNFIEKPEGAPFRYDANEPARPHIIVPVEGICVSGNA